MYCKPRDARKGVSNRTTLNRSGRLLCGGHFFVPTFDAETMAAGTKLGPYAIDVPLGALSELKST